ncbi:VOC family protein [Jiangella rhizosphaerae]|uniref:VOC family protein n=1 Tax=Jiangella rhizosphaerae TaxID=2293569 RepID=A0A418KTP7_9ACTN|nr:VOC family protein [Jiangella rhizosphaerae]RIQ29563.1 VOC family protein [Jiangella rhizosphaerae]
MNEITVTPKLVVDSADRAIDFYRRALSAEPGVRYAGPDGRVVYAEFRLGASTLSIKDADEHDPAAGALFTLDVPDANAVGAALEQAGATVVFPIDDQPYGLRQGRLRDPFGIQWIVSQQTDDLSPDEVQRRLDSTPG